MKLYPTNDEGNDQQGFLRAHIRVIELPSWRDIRPGGIKKKRPAAEI